LLRRFGYVVLLAAVLAAGCSSSEDPVVEPPASGCPAPTPVTIDVPRFPEMVHPAGNPLTREGIALGRRLFYDPILSGDSTQACASCHQQAHAFGDPRRFSVGIDGIEGDRQAPTIINAGWLPAAFWDGRADGLEAQAREPVPNPIEMHIPWEEAVARLEAHPEYPDSFCAAFGTKEITVDRVVMAIAQFERTFVSNNSKYDRFLRGEATLTPVEEAGRQLFFTEVADCFHCHGQEVGFDGGFHNIGLDSVIVDNGRGDITGDPDDDGKFKSPSLRNVMVSAPYMHDGRFNTIDEVIGHYEGGFHKSPLLDPLISARDDPGRRRMRPGEIDTLVVFLHTFTDTTFLNDPRLSNPFTGAAQE
jgi:cytochrome c peroxidase